MTPQDDSPLRAALAPSALKGALVPHRPVFGDPWDSPADMFACYVAVSVIGPLLLWAGGALMGAIFGFGSHWRLGVFIAGALAHPVWGRSGEEPAFCLHEKWQCQHEGNSRHRRRQAISSSDGSI